MTLDDILDDILNVEGGFVDDPDDPGGATNHGVSLRYARGIGLDLDGDGDTDRDDIMIVTPGGARILFKQDFFYQPKINRLPKYLWSVMFDMSVNHGAPRAIMILQEAINRLLGCAHLVVDGRIGSKTVTCLEKFEHRFGPALVNTICLLRENFYYELAATHPQRFTKYVLAKDGGIGGWIKRARSFQLP